MLLRNTEAKSFPLLINNLARRIGTGLFQMRISESLLSKMTWWLFHCAQGTLETHSLAKWNMLPNTQSFNAQAFGGMCGKDLAVKCHHLLENLNVPNSASFVTNLFLLWKQIHPDLKEQLNNSFKGSKRFRTNNHSMSACTKTTAPCPVLETTFSAATLGHKVTDVNGGQPALLSLWRNWQIPLPPWGWVKRRSGEQHFSTRGKHPATVMLKGCLCYLFLYLDLFQPFLHTEVKGFLILVLTSCSY